MASHVRKLMEKVSYVDPNQWICWKSLLTSNFISVQLLAAIDYDVQTGIIMEIDDECHCGRMLCIIFQYLVDIYTAHALLVILADLPTTIWKSTITLWCTKLACVETQRAVLSANSVLLLTQRKNYKSQSKLRHIFPNEGVGSKTIFYKIFFPYFRK